MEISFIDLKRQQNHISRELEHAIFNVLNKGNYIMGEECLELEKQLALYTNRKY